MLIPLFYSRHQPLEVYQSHPITAHLHWFPPISTRFSCAAQQCRIGEDRWFTEFNHNVPQIAAASGHRSLTGLMRYNHLRRTAAPAFCQTTVTKHEHKETISTLAAHAAELDPALGAVSRTARCIRRPITGIAGTKS
ncbi:MULTISPECIES: hypothetical protein [unclassified Bradyrhizobium]|uniref:hypothetical protein n=1 Tax=unclassified Bradyrhizobium TaxID=2631580 RepID=UPI0028E8A384|nr:MULTISPECIES: hypothetical protein [unclassified Bradyrhizobium]